MTLLYVLVSHFCSRDLMVSSKKMNLYLTCARILAREAHSESVRAYLTWIWQKLGDVISWVRVSNVGMVGGRMCTPKNPMIGHLWLSQLMWDSVLIHTVLERYSSKLSQVFLPTLVNPSTLRAFYTEISSESVMQPDLYVCLQFIVRIVCVLDWALSDFPVICINGLVFPCKSVYFQTRFISILTHSHRCLLQIELGD
jgi:hypothetical protein